MSPNIEIEMNTLSMCVHAYLRCMRGHVCPLVGLSNLSPKIEITRNHADQILAAFTHSETRPYTRQDSSGRLGRGSNTKTA